MVDPAKAEGYRKLRFETVDQMRAEIDRIAAADAAGRLKQIGNWSAGQFFSHLAAWIEYGYDGYPLKPPPWIIRVIIRWRMGKYLRDGMPRGVRIPNTPEGTFGQDASSTAEA